MLLASKLTFICMVVQISKCLSYHWSFDEWDDDEDYIEDDINYHDGLLNFSDFDDFHYPRTRLHFDESDNNYDHQINFNDYFYPPNYGFNFDIYDYYEAANNWDDDRALLELNQESVEGLLAILHSLHSNDRPPIESQPMNPDQLLPVLQRRKRGFRRSSRSRSSSRTRSSSSSSRRSSVFGGLFGRKSSSSPSESSSSREKKKILKKTEKAKEAESSQPAELYPKGNYPAKAPENTAGSPQFSGYPRQPQPGYPGGGTGGGYPHQPSSGYPNPGATGGVYPKQPTPGYPHTGGAGGVYPNPQPPGVAGGYPQQPSAGYPGPAGTYPKQPTPGYPHPGGNYPHQPSSGYPYPGSTGAGYPTHTSFGGMGGHSPSGNYPKMSKKKKIAEKIKQAVKGYAAYKMQKKLNKKKSKFISPFALSGMHGSGFYPGLGHGIGSSSGTMKVGKKIIGTIIKLQIAKYALKFGAKAAKTYFEYKLGRSLSDHMIEKFVGRYHKQQMRHYFRKNRRVFKNQDFKLKNITLGDDCARDCKIAHDDDKRICFFRFHVHLYQYLSRACYKCPESDADCDRPDCVVGSGRRKLVTVINKRLPGPTIQVCEGDLVLLEVHNEMPSSGVTFHFRGQTYSEDPSMEGTPGLTQSPINPGDIFIYNVKADGPGTHFWHANIGLLKSEGAYGPLIVQKIPQSTHSDVQEEVSDGSPKSIMVSEDFEKNGEEQLINMNHRKGKIEIHSLLINGRGAKIGKDTSRLNRPPLPYSRLKAEASGKKTRFRLISGVSSNCPFTFRILDRTFSVVEMDGSRVEPKDVQILLVSPGERYDIILDAMPMGTLNWVEVQGKLDCEDLAQLAVLEYGDFGSLAEIKPVLEHQEKEPKPLKLPPKTPEINTEVTKYGVYCNGTEVTCAKNLTTVSSFPVEMSNPNGTIYLSLTQRAIHNENFYSLLHYDIATLSAEEKSFTSQINNLTLKLPPEPLLVNQKPLKNAVCSSAGVLRQHCVESFCECLHLLQLPLGTVNEVVLINEGPENNMSPQTMYFHGHNVWIISQSKAFLPNNETLDNSTSPYMDRLRVIIRDAEESLIRNTKAAVRMNSITVPEGGYAIIRFNASNPGYWLLESSSIFKSATGMGVVFKIGEDGQIPSDSLRKSRC